MNRVLITGASGFIGRHCLAMLVTKGYEVHALSRRRVPENALAGVFWHEVDLLLPGCAAELFSRVRPDYLLHLAWYAVPGKFWEARQNIDWVRASLEVLCAFADNSGKRLVAAGSCAEYDWSTGECREDSTPLLPTTLYGTSKHAFERILHFSGRQTHLSSAWGRVFFLYGPYEDPSRLVAYSVDSLLRGEPALCSEGTQVRDFMHVEDVASAFIALLESKVQGPVNIGSGNAVAVRDVVQEIGRQLRRPDLLHIGALNAKSEPPSIWANIERLAMEVGWKPRYDLASGIKQTIEWRRNLTSTAARAPIQCANQ